VSTPYKDQWVLERPRPEPNEERAAAHEARQPHTLRERGRGAHPAVPSTFRRRVRKRPRWIDRDT
jgi:hypothetical protein